MIKIEKLLIKAYFSGTQAERANLLVRVPQKLRMVCPSLLGPGPYCPLPLYKIENCSYGASTLWVTSVLPLGKARRGPSSSNSVLFKPSTAWPGTFSSLCTIRSMLLQVGVSCNNKKKSSVLLSILDITRFQLYFLKDTAFSSFQGLRTCAQQSWMVSDWVPAEASKKRVIKCILRKFQNVITFRRKRNPDNEAEREP